MRVPWWQPTLLLQFSRNTQSWRPNAILDNHEDNSITLHRNRSLRCPSGLAFCLFPLIFVPLSLSFESTFWVMLSSPPIIAAAAAKAQSTSAAPRRTTDKRPQVRCPTDRASDPTPKPRMIKPNAERESGIWKDLLTLHGSGAGVSWRAFDFTWVVEV